MYATLREEGNRIIAGTVASCPGSVLTSATEAGLVPVSPTTVTARGLSAPLGV